MRQCGSYRGIAVFLLAAVAGMALAREHPLPVSAYRKYFWGARDAFDRRQFKTAQSLFDTYRDLGSPSDRLVKQSGCDAKEEVTQFAALLKETRACMKRRRESACWLDPEKAKIDILKALQSGQADPLAGYLDCALIDLASPGDACEGRKYAAPADWPRFVAAVHAKPSVYKEPDWRDFNRTKKDYNGMAWVLYPVQPQWKPCGTPGAPLVGLRQDSNGQLRIAGFAASCL